MNQPLHETNRYQDSHFPVGMYTVNRAMIIPEGRGFNDLHWHEELQFTLVTCEQVTYQVSGVEYELREGEGLFINKGLLHVTSHMTHNAAYVSFNFPDTMLSYFTGSRMELDYVFPYTANYTFPVTVFRPDGGWQHEVLEIMRELRRIFDQGREYGWEYAVSIKISQMWYLMFKNLAGSLRKAPKSFIRKQERMQFLLSFIHQNYAAEIGMEDIAAAAKISVMECHRCFKSSINKTPYEYLLSYRISKSMELLASTDLSITEIAGRVGFNNISNYIQTFRKRAGRTPADYREYLDGCGDAGQRLDK